jgi:Chaperone of endosialidase
MEIASTPIKKAVLSTVFSGLTLLLSAQSVSDTDIKRNVSDISTSVQKLVQLEPKVFEYNTEKYKHLKLKGGKTYGFMSDNMQQVFPELVSTKSTPYMFGKNVYRDAQTKVIDESSLIPILVASIKEQHAEIMRLRKDVDELKKSTGGK